MTLEIAKILNINSPILAGIAAIMTIETSVSESFKTGKYRMYGTVFGALVALIITSISPINFLTTAIGLFVIIYISNMLKWKDAIKMAMIVFLVIILNYDEGHRLMYALNRTVDTFIGVIVGTAVNYFIRPPKIDMKIDSFIENMIREVRENIYLLVWEDKQPKLNNLKKEIIDIEENYEVLKKDVKFNVNVEADDSLTDYEKIFNMFHDIQSHFRVIKLLDKRDYLDKKNQKMIVDMFCKKIPSSEIVDVKEDEREERDIIYNYHLKKILYDIRDIEKLYGNRQECIMREE